MKYFAEDLPDTVTYYDKELNITGNIHLIKRSFSIRSHPEECVQLVSKTTSLHLQWQVLDHKSPFVLQEENPCYTWMQNVLKVAKRNQYSAIDYTRMSYCFPQKIDYIQLSKWKSHKNLPIALEWSKIPLIREIPDPHCRKNPSASPLVLENYPWLLAPLLFQFYIVHLDGLVCVHWLLQWPDGNKHSF